MHRGGEPERLLAPEQTDVFARMCELLGWDAPEGIRIYPEDIEDDEGHD